jgi:hypothetical protein
MTNRIAQKYANKLSGQRFDDAISICDHVSRVYGEELTVNEGRTVYNAITPAPVRLDYHIEQATARE